MSERTPAQEKINHIVAEINTPKSRLMEYQRQLENTKGCATAARQLGAIIGRLEAWQTKHKK